MALSKRIEPTLLTDQVYASLHDAILSGDMPTGTRLRIRDIAQEVGTSVMPVREAIRRLEEAGLAERSPHKGAVVRTLSLEELVHVYETRRILEAAAAREGAARIDEAGLEEMRTQLELLRSAVDEGRLLDALDIDEALLAALYGASGNPFLVKVVRGLWQDCRPYKVMGARGSVDTGTASTLWRFPQQLVEAAAAHDGEAAATLTGDSLTSATQRIEAQLEAQRSEQNR
ncbi:GntR family transcriptional regulator [Brachybacterium sp. ACRRE]|uniref:GntR family transcriptional regulator n=1 Tax=Brachybacterium sp. ACRRE TaxID=2918184 RepID=UPI001EF340B5|nr:GntR family transcriptional regulator [Brachybacterium sp. ACRRE]